jgi:hypothetical protein
MPSGVKVMLAEVLPSALFTTCMVSPVFFFGTKIIKTGLQKHTKYIFESMEKVSRRPQGGGI